MTDFRANFITEFVILQHSHYDLLRHNKFLNPVILALKKDNLYTINWR